MKTVYLSYSGRNCEAVLQVMERVIAKGYGLLCDCMLPQKGSLADRAAENIRRADLMVAAITEDAADCPYIETELDIGLDLGARLLLVVVEDAPLPPKHRVALEHVPVCSVSAYPTEEEMAVVEEWMKGAVI